MIDDLFNLIDSSKKIVDDFRMIRPKMTAFVLQSITPAGEEKIKERYRSEWTKAINEDDIIAIIKLVIICHTSTGKHIKKLIKQKSISRDEAKFKCKFCQIDGHFEVYCRKKKAESKDKSSDNDKASKDKDTRA